MFVNLKTAILLIFVVVVIACQPNKEKNQSAEQLENETEMDTIGWWNGLEPGPHAVGFEVRYSTDSRRSYRKPLSTEAGNQLFPRPMQISIWYPAISNTGAEHTSFQDYANLIPYEEGLTIQKGEGNLPTGEDIFVKYVHTLSNVSNSISEDLVKEILNKPTLVTKNATPLDGQFPVILYGSGGGGHSFQNSVMMEYLASHGYIVAAVPSFSRRIKSFGIVGTGTTSTWHFHALQEQIRDMEFLIEYMEDFPNTDISRIGSVASSAGGTADVLMAMENPQILALVNLEGGISFKSFVEIEGPDSLTTSRYQAGHATNLRVPILHMIRKLLVGHVGFNQDLYDQAKYNEFYRLEFEGFDHTDLSSLHIYRLRLADLDKDKPSNEKVVNGYNATIEYAVHFLNAYVKGQNDDKTFLMNDPVENGFPPEVMTITRQLPDFVPPTPQEFAGVILDSNITTAREIYESVKSKAPDYVLINPYILGRIGNTLYEQGRVEDALGIYEILCSDYPSSRVFGLFGRILEKQNQLAEAQIQYAKALELAPGDQNIIQALKRVNHNK